MKNIVLFLRYDGTNYHGWQSQKNGTTVQEVVSEAIRRLTGQPPLPELHGCGRTDAGVHALHYVANFHSATTIPVDRLPYALKPYLPADVACYDACAAPEDFHARFSCLEKKYVYKLYSARIPDPFLINRAYFTPMPLDVGLMREAAARIVGTHDFACFRASGFTSKGSVRTVFSCSVDTHDDQTVSVSVSADGFLYNMVRIIAGTLFYVGIGKFLPEDIDHMLASRDRLTAGVTLPPHGLYLESARYPAGSFIR